MVKEQPSSPPPGSSLRRISARGRARRRRAALALLLLALPLIGIAALAWRVWDADQGVPQRAEQPATPLDGAGPRVGVPVPASSLPSPPAATPIAGDAAPVPVEPGLAVPGEGTQLTRLVIPKAKVDHHFVVKGLTARREMEEPGDKDDVAWYNFSALPGFGSNAVLSGHVDWYTGQPGVFWYLRALKEGDDVEVHYSDGLVLKYRVSRVEVYGAGDAPVAEITAPTVKDTLTMITCDGVFSRSTRDYNQRRVVWAERVG